jgi:hypothetical protein
MSRRSAHRLSVVVLIAGSAACDDISTSPPRVHEVALTRPVVSLTAPGDYPAAEVFGLRVDADPGLNRTVRWSSSDTTVAAIDDGGILHLCVLSPEVTITARSVADTTKSASARIGVASVAVGWMGVVAISDVRSGAPLDGSRLHGTVSLDLAANADRLDCTGLSRLEVLAFPIAESAGVGISITNLTFTPARRRALQQTVTWHTDNVPNGDYRLETRAYLAGRAVPVSTETRFVTVRN